MQNSSYTIRIHVAEGHPDKTLVIDKMNWTGVVIRFARTDLEKALERDEFKRMGVYLLVGYQEGDDDLPAIYVGQADNLKSRIEQHEKDKDFWDWGLVFTSSNEGLNRAHVTWLEHVLIQRAAKAKDRCNLVNSVEPKEPKLSEFERSDTNGFLQEVLQILPLLGLHIFQDQKPLTPAKIVPKNQGEKPDVRDTIVVPAQENGFQETFLGEQSWYAVRISSKMRQHLRYVAAYRISPIAAITHWAEVDRIEPYGDDGKFKIYFKAPAKELAQRVPFGNVPSGSMQSPRYANFNRLQSAKNLGELLNIPPKS